MVDAVSGAADHVHTRSVAHKVFDVWRNPGRFTKNPDIVRLASDRLLLIYADTDQHWSMKNQVLTLLASDDDGLTWFKHREVATADPTKGDERLVTPRLSLLSDGRLVVLIDHDDFGHFHEDQPSGNDAYWSSDGGDTWTGPEKTGILGFEPDRILELPDGRLMVGTHLMRGATQEYAEVVSFSRDGGKQWTGPTEIAHDGCYRYCEGGIVLLDAGRLACIMRDSFSSGRPSFVSFSDDCGATWSRPAMLPFSFHRPYGKQLPDGRVLVTGRNVNGGLGTYAWCGDLAREAGRCEIGGPRTVADVALASNELTIRNRLGYECRYSLLPPESPASPVRLDAEVCIDGPPDTDVAFLSISRLSTRRGGLVLFLGRNFLALANSNAQSRKYVDFSTFRRVSIEHRRGLLAVSVDGERVLNDAVFHDELAVKDFYGAGPLHSRTRFGQIGDTGSSRWRHVHYRVENPIAGVYEWEWRARDGRYPDQYQRDRLIQIHANRPDQRPGPDNGYSSWLMLPDGRIILVDYTNCGDEPGKSHLVGVHLTAEDIA